MTNEELKSELLESRLVIEQAEVILSNLIKFNNYEDDCFNIAHDDVIATLNAALRILRSDIN
ncbi:hypothetical protein RJ41_09020 [Alteromonas marina]|uniref:Uncharacterized protein n=1 Tax=Alteromonas marina TaxID=203795 RepID=A0A0B3Y9B7_9ALTE|nr:hypothetical protein RJ41_09020 [Alteromonas marina]